MQRGKHPSEKITEWLRPEWRAYESVFDYNNKVFRVLGGLADCLILGALWIVCSIPVVTMGAATAAVYHAVNKSIVHGQGYAFREYCTALKADLKQTTGAWLLWGNTGSVSCGGPCGDQTVSGTGLGAWCVVLFFYCTFCHGAGVGVLPDGVYGEV